MLLSHAGITEDRAPRKQQVVPPGEPGTHPANPKVFNYYADDEPNAKELEKTKKGKKGRIMWDI